MLCATRSDRLNFLIQVEALRGPPIAVRARWHGLNGVMVRYAEIILSQSLIGIERCVAFIVDSFWGACVRSLEAVHTRPPLS